MHLLIIHQHFVTRKHSGSTRTYEFARHMVGRGHKVTVIAGPACIHRMEGGLATRAEIDGMDAIALNVNYSNFMGYWRRALAFINHALLSAWFSLWVKDVDVIYASSTPLTVGVAGRVASIRHGAPFIFEVNDLWPEFIEDFGIIKSRLVIGALRRMAAYFYKKARAVVFVSEAMQRRAEALYPGLSGKSHVFPLGADMDLDELYEDFDLPPEARGKFVISYVGAVSYVNRVERVLRVAERLKGKGAFFIIAGDGKDMPGLLALKEELELDNLAFLGKVSKRKAYGIIRESDACFLSNIYKDESGRVYINALDTLTNKFFDYMAAGKPIIINYEGLACDYIREYRCGIRVSFDDPGLAAAEIENLMLDPGLCRKMGENGRRLAEDKFDRKKLAREWELMLSDAMKSAEGLKIAEGL